MKKSLITVTVLAVSASMLFGCAKQKPVDNLEAYESVLSNLEAGQCYAFAEICKDYDVLLVTDDVYDNGKGDLESGSARLYGLDKTQKVFELGEVSSTSTAYPLAVYDGCLMFGGHHHVAEVFTDGASLITSKDASEVFDENGNASYYYFDLANKFEGEVEDDSEFMAMWEDYEKASVICFTQPDSVEAGKALTITDSTVISPDGWKFTYDPEKFCLNTALGEGETAFNYLGACSGTAALIISYVPDQMPDAALYEKLADFDPELVERDEGSYANAHYWAHFRTILPEGDPAENADKDLIYRAFTGIEHNGGTVIIEQLQHEEKDDAQYSDLVNAFSELTNTFELLDHEPQTEYAYVIGTYTHSYTDEIGGETIDCTDKVIMNDDHTCMISFQDDIAGEWTGSEIRLNNADAFEYTVEGDALYLNIDDEWREFQREIPS